MAEIRLNEAEWNQLSADSQAQIQGILEANGLLKEGDSIVPDPNAPTATMILQAQQTQQFAISQSMCENLCNVAEAAAHAACGLIPNPVEQAVCNAAATVAGNACRNACKGLGKSSVTP